MLLGKSITLALLTLAAPEHREHGAHVHGMSELEVVLDQGLIEASLRGPGVNFFGFERQPTSSEEWDAVDGARLALSSPDEFVRWDQAAGCELVESEIQLPFDDNHHEDHHGHDHHDDDRRDENQHAEVSARWQWRCDSNRLPQFVEFEIHRVFPGTDTVDLTMLTATGGSVVESIDRTGQRVDLQ